MIIDAKGKLFGRVSIVDISIILIIIAAFLGVGYKFAKSGNWGSNSDQDNIQIVFYQEETPEYVAKAIKIGDVATESIQKANFGKVSDIKISKSVSWVATDKGDLISTSKNGYSSIYITINGKGKYTSHGLIIKGADYYIGKTIELRVGNSVFYGKIYDFKKAS